jgi:hypothetical protein
MKFKIKGECVVTLEHKDGEKTSAHVYTDYNVSVSKNVDQSIFLDENGLPTAEGHRALTQCFVQGLIGNIHTAHQKGFRNDAEHLRYVISELERGFIQIATIGESKFDL